MRMPWQANTCTQSRGYSITRGVFCAQQWEERVGSAPLKGAGTPAILITNTVYKEIAAHKHAHTTYEASNDAHW